MTDRERWIVYPLLFLTMGIALRDKITKSVSSDHIVCRELIVTDAQGNERITLGTNRAGGAVRIRGEQAGLNILLGHYDNFGGLLFTDQQGNVRPQSVVVNNAPPRQAAPVVRGLRIRPATPPPAAQESSPPPPDETPGEQSEEPAAPSETP